MYEPFLQITEFLQSFESIDPILGSLEPRVSDNDGESSCDLCRTYLESGSMRWEELQSMKQVGAHRKDSEVA